MKDLAGNIGHSSVITINLLSPSGAFAEEKYGTGGLVAVNTDGTLYDGTGAIREYRYSGATVNNYIKFNNGEIWRIVGIFKNSSDEWNLKIMRNTVLTSAELPNTYTYGGTSFTIESNTSGFAYWNKSGTTDNNDWTTAGLQYYLNGNDGYFGTLSDEAQTLVDASYTYYLGNVTNYNNSADDTVISSYIRERGSTICDKNLTLQTQNNNCNVWYGNKAIWSGKVALLYPSDYGYSASSTYWSGTTLYKYNTSAANTSWMFKTANHTYYEWLMSPGSSVSDAATYLITAGYVSNFQVYIYGYGVRPVLNLLASAPIDTNHQGTESDPYIVLE